MIWHNIPTTRDKMARSITYAEAICEALRQKLDQDKAVYLIGQGVPDASQTYGTTKNLEAQYPDRVFDCPISEGAVVGILLGSSLAGLKPVMVMARFEFLMLAIDQLVNQAAKWHFMFSGQAQAAITLRVIVGRGWGQGPQHSQSLHAWFAHVPGLKVVMPATPFEAKGLLISSIDDPNPVLFIEHRWLHHLHGNVPKAIYHLPFGGGTLMSSGKDVTLVSLSYATIDALKAVRLLEKEGISVDLLNIHTLNPFDDTIILESVKKTGKLLVCDYACDTGSFASEIVSRVCGKAFSDLKAPPLKVTLPDAPVATTRAIANFYYPTPQHIVNAVKSLLGLPLSDPFLGVKPTDLLDIPDRSFTGPF
jgi:acetoin:2,6-dichlorophenolindophenol oxidoreductase subunit beta